MKAFLATVAVGALASACFENSDGADTREIAARLTVESIAAFPDIQANLTTDPAAAGEALGKFIRTPVTASEMVDQPFDGSVPVSRQLDGVSFAAIPGCLTTSGETGCDRFDTNAGETCDGPGIQFTGFGERTCGGSPECSDVTDCSYDWDVTITFADPDLGTIEVRTISADGGFTVSPGQLTASITFPSFDIFDPSGNVIRSGALEVCTCGPMPFNAAGPINSSFVVRDLDNVNACALATFDGQGDVTVSGDCACGNGQCN